MDERLRRLERRAAQGDLDAEAALLLERVRLEDVSRETLRLLAYLDHAPARCALAGEGPPVIDEDLRLWLYGLTQWGRPSLVAALAALAREVLPVFEAAFPDDPRPARALRAAEDALLPSEGNQAARAASAAATAAQEAAAKAAFGPAHWAAFAAQAAAEAAAGTNPLQGTHDPEAHHLAGAAVDAALHAGASEDRLRAAVRAALVRLALG